MTQDSQGVRRVLLTLLLCCGLLHALSCARLSQNVEDSRPQSSLVAQTLTPDGPRINLNTATAEEIERLPGIGKGLAARIISHRARYGRFRRAEHLIMVRGLSDERFRKIRELVFVE
jgi:competence ComEA-like helix-hairpin-helix protein